VLARYLVLTQIFQIRTTQGIYLTQPLMRSLWLLTMLTALTSAAAFRSAAPTQPRYALLRGGASAPKFSDAAPMASVMTVHALCLGACAMKVSSSIGMGVAVALVASAGLTVSQNFPAYMAGVHLALLLQAGSAGVFGVQAARAGLAQVQGAKMCSLTEKLLPYAAMTASSIVGLGGLKKFKPKKKAA
jgi:hypothetical protein